MSAPRAEHRSPDGARRPVAAAEVAVLGGGPAGMAAALALAREGFSVAVLERTDYDAPRLGETLPPWVIRPLARLGVWETFLRAGHQPAPGIISEWGGSGVSSNDFIFNPHGTGWHLDRARFDRMLADAAEAAGCSVYRSVRAKQCSRSERGAWRILAGGGEADTLLIEAEWLIDASGRASSFARGLGGGRRAYDRLAAVVGFSAPAQGHSQTVIEACDLGWWYAATLPGCRAVAAFFTDVDLLPRDPMMRKTLWQEKLRETRLASALFREDIAPHDLKLVAANSAKLESAAGPGWLAVGDAAQSHDPLSGQGVANALWSGLAAADAIQAHRDGDWSAPERFAAANDSRFEQYSAARVKYYGLENRWPESIFWRRRSSFPPRPESEISRSGL